MVNMNEMTPELLSELTFTEEELAMLAKAKKQPIFFDEDCQEITPEQAIHFRRVNPPRDILGKMA